MNTLDTDRVRLPCGQADPAASIQAVAWPKLLYLPLHGYDGAVARPLVSAGSRLLPGRRLARFPDGSYLTSQVEGVSDGLIIGPVMHPLLKEAPQLVISSPLAPQEPESPPSCELESILREHRLIGHGGAGYPTWRKLPARFGKACRLLLVNAVECDPSLSSDAALLHHHFQQLTAACLRLAKLTRSERALLAVKQSTWSRLAAPALPNGLELFLAEDHYPAGYEPYLVSRVLGESLQGPPAAQGVLSLNLATVFALDRLCRSGRLPATRLVTVIGQNRQLVARVPIGMRMAALLKALAMPVTRATTIIAGGLLAGDQVQPDTPVHWNCNGIYLVEGREQPIQCINCGFCEAVCPELLSPQQLLIDCQSTGPATHLDHCIECGACDQVCPSHLPLRATFTAGKRTRKEQLREAAFAGTAAERFSRHSSRSVARESARREKHALARKKRDGRATLSAILQQNQEKK